MDNINYKKRTSILLIFSLIGIVIYFIVFLVPLIREDPLQLRYKGHFDFSKTVSDTMIQIPSIIRNHNFDSIILRSSVFTTVSAKEASDKLGGEFVNVSFPAASYLERSLILNKALKKNLFSVIYSFDSFYLSQGYLEFRTSKGRRGTALKILCDDIILNDFMVYLLFNKQKFAIPFRNKDRPNSGDLTHNKSIEGLINWIEVFGENGYKRFMKTVAGEA